MLALLIPNKHWKHVDVFKGKKRQANIRFILTLVELPIATAIHNNTSSEHFPCVQKCLLLFVSQRSFRKAFLWK